MFWNPRNPALCAQDSEAARSEMCCQLRDEQLRGEEEQFSAASPLPSHHEPEEDEARFDCRADKNTSGCSHLHWILMTVVA